MAELQLPDKVKNLLTHYWSARYKIEVNESKDKQDLLFYNSAPKEIKNELVKFNNEMQKVNPQFSMQNLQLMLDDFNIDPEYVRVILNEKEPFITFWTTEGGNLNY